MQLKKVNWYGFDHNKITEIFEGQLTFVNEFCVNEEYKPVAVYRAAKPNRKKGHKDYMLLQTETDAIGNNKKRGLVRGMDQVEMEKWRYQTAVHCLECDTVLYSINRHHCHKCDCPNETMVDGGREYSRYGGMVMAKVKLVRLDLLTDTVENV